MTAGALQPIRLGKYELRGRLAVGGMAELFVARTTAIHGFEKLVALKRVLPQHVSNERLIRLLMHEARLSAGLHHPNIAQVYDVGEYGGTYFFTMEYVLGKDLREIVRAAQERRRWLPLEHAIQLVIGVAAALHYAHTARGPAGQPLGIIHRDVSPSNILVSYDGVVKLVDFGIAIAATLDMNSGGQLPAGKIPYMSPEQCRDETIDARSDIFSLGIILWELTVGKRLFVSKGNPVALLGRIASEPAPPPSAVRSDYPEELERIVTRALELDPERRYRTAQELQVDLEEFVREERLSISATRLAAYMQELFADELKAPQPLNLDGVAETTPMPVAVAEVSPASMPRPAGSPPSLMPAILSPAPASVIPPPAAEEEAEPPSRRRLGLYGAIGVAAVAVLAWAWSAARADRGGPEPDRQVEKKEEAVAASDPPRPVPKTTSTVVTPEPKPARREEAPALVEDGGDAKPAKKTDRADKRSNKKKQVWDPNSALPPT